MAQTIKTRICLRRDTAANWTSNNPVLLAGEMGIETNTRKFKFGDGTTHWNDLPYASIDDHDTTYTLGVSGNNITLTPSSGTAQSITAPFATNSTYAEKIGNSSNSYTYTQLVNAFSGKLSLSGGIMDGVIGFRNGYDEGFGVFGPQDSLLGLYIDQEGYYVAFDTDGTLRLSGESVNISSNGDIIFNPADDVKIGNDIVATQTWANGQFQTKLPTVTSALYDKYLHTNASTGALEWVYVAQGSATWGQISGSLSAQTDLMNEFAKYGALAGNNTWSGTNTFNGNVSITNSPLYIGNGSGTGIRFSGGTSSKNIELLNSGTVQYTLTLPSETGTLATQSYVTGRGYITKDANNLTYYTKSADLATVATSGSYNDLSNKLSAGTNVTIGADNKINAVDTTYTLGVSGNSVTLTPTGSSAQTITVPFATNATNATNATYLGTSSAGWTYSTLNTELQNIRDIAGGKTATYVTNKTKESGFNSQNDTITISKTSIALEDGTSVNISNLKVGDIFLLSDTDLPDRWVKSKTSSSVTLGKMESSKIDLTQYVNALSGTANSGVVTNITKSGQTITVTSKSLATSDPTASGNSTSYIDSISQAADGKITATKKTIPDATSSVKGITTVGASGGAAAYSHTHSVLTFTDAGGTSKTYNGGSTQTINYVSTTDNTVIWDCGGANQ